MDLLIISLNFILDSMHGVDFLNIQYIFYKIYTFITSMGSVKFKADLIEKWPLWAMISLVVSMFLGFFVIYFNMKIKEVKKLDEKIFGTVLVPADDGKSGQKNERWLKVLQHLETDSQAEWKAAILEADVILDEMTIKMGYRGNSLGERLKSVEPSDFLTINKAWEAHKVRNAIAHDGSDYFLTKREVKRVIDLYRQVFEEFDLI